MKKNVLFFVLFVGLSVALFSIHTPCYAADTIKVGIVDTYSGPTTIFTLDVLDGFKLAVGKINEKGGVLGRKIEYTTRDDKYQPDVALSMAKELVMREKVDILMGTINSPAALAVSDFAKKEKIPFFVTFSKTYKLTGEEGHRYIFDMSENMLMAGKAAASVLAKKPYVKYWIAGEDYESGHDLASATWDTLKKLKPSVQLMGESWWKIGETDIIPYITQIIAAKPDFLIVSTGGSGMVNFQKVAKTTGLLQKVPFYQHTANEHSNLAAMGLDAPEGIFGTCNYFFYYPDTAANRSFVAEFRKAYNRYPRIGALYGYMTAQFISEGFKKAGKIDKEGMIDALEGMTLDSPVGRLTLRACDHQIELPMYWGVTKKDPKYPDFLISADNQPIQAKDYMPTCEEVLKNRKK